MNGRELIKRFTLSALALTMGCTYNALAQVPVFTEAGGVVVIEAESFSNNTARVISGTNFQWIATNAVSGYSGSGYMQALPNNGINENVTWQNVSPQLDYAVNFANALTHYVWIRGYAVTNTDDSVHAGINATTNSAAGITLNQYNVWQWTRTNTLGGVATLTVNATGTQTVSLWMREDGMIVDRILLTTNNNFQPIIGQVFHIPSSFDSNLNSTMRNPVSGITSNTAVAIYSGNQATGPGGNPGNQLQTGSTVFYRNATNSTWLSTNMLFFTQGPSPFGSTNKYYSATIPANLFNPGDTVQYYLKIPYSDHLPTFVYGNDNASQSSEIESVAQASPFSYTIAPPLQASGPYVACSNVVGSTLYEARVYQNTGHVTLSGPDLAGNPLANTVTVEPLTATANGSGITAGTVLSTTTLSNGMQFTEVFGATSIVVQVTFPQDNVMHYEVVDWGAQVLTSTTITVPSDSSEHFYGFGEKFNALDQAGNRVHIMTYDTSTRSAADDTYAVAPWFISSRGYGFDLDSTDESYFDMRNSQSDRYVINNLVGSSFSGYVTNAVKFNVVYGPHLPDVLTRYTSYKGRPLLPPPWAFMPWMSSDIWSSGGEVRYVITKLRERGVPGSVFVFDSPWETAYNDFTWNTSQFSPGGTFEGTNWPGFSSIGDMMTFLRTNGYKVICWFTPYIDTSSNGPECASNCEYNVCINENFGTASNYASALASNLFVHAVSGGTTNVLSVTWWKGTGSPLDFTNPNAVQYLQSTLSNLVNQSGGVIGGFKTDDGEGNPFIPANALYADGRTGVEMQNGYCLEYQKTVSAVLGTNGILWGRSGFAGSQAYPAIWAGDNEPNYGDPNGLPAVILAGEGCAMSGFSIWGSDICGYEDGSWSGTPTNLFMRWTQFGAFSPIMQMHRQVGLCRIYPWSFGDDALTNYQFYAQLHTALFPYIYSYATQASTSGLPILRPLVLMYQTDANVYGSDYNTRHSFLFGNELLVAPVITNTATTRTAYLPQGNWYDYFSNVRYSGGQTITWVNANQHQMPLFVREGAVIPMISTNVQTMLDASYTSNPNLITPGNSLQFLIYPTTNSSFTVYDGTSLSCQSNGTVISATLFANPRPMLLRFFAAQPFGVERDGVRLPQMTNATDFAAASLGWFYDGAGFVNVKFSHMGGSTTIAFAPDSVGDGISDSWRATHFGAVTTNGSSCATCDPDGDGLDNLQEYLAGTDPIDASNYLHVNSSILSGDNMSISFSSVLGMNYEVEYSSDLVTGTWQILTNGITGTGGILPIIDPGAASLPQRFYRVKLLP